MLFLLTSPLYLCDFPLPWGVSAIAGFLQAGHSLVGLISLVAALLSWRVVNDV